MRWNLRCPDGIKYQGAAVLFDYLFVMLSNLTFKWLWRFALGFFAYQDVRLQTYSYRTTPPICHHTVTCCPRVSSVRAQVVHRPRGLVATFAVEFSVVHGVHALLAAAEPVDAADDVRAAKYRDSVIWQRRGENIEEQSQMVVLVTGTAGATNSLMLPAVTGWYVGRKSMIEMKIW